MLDLRLALHVLPEELSERATLATEELLHVLRHLPARHLGLGARGYGDVNDRGSDAGRQSFHRLVEGEDRADAVGIERSRRGCGFGCPGRGRLYANS